MTSLGTVSGEIRRDDHWRCLTRAEGRGRWRKIDQKPQIAFPLQELF
jgi:hypothetical protein